MALEDEKKADVESQHAEHAVEAELGDVEKVDLVPSIEEAAASTAAWLIAVTVSLGGFVSFPLLENDFFGVGWKRPLFLIRFKWWWLRATTLGISC